jgi:alpha-N-acetylglucosamine transferase
MASVFAVVLFGGKSASDYLNGVLALKQSMINVGTVYELVCLITADFPRAVFETLALFGIRTITIPYISGNGKIKTQRQNYIYAKWIDNAFTKWNVLNPDVMKTTEGVPYEKVFLMDADSLLMENCDELFELQTPAMTFSSPWGAPFIPNRGTDPYKQPIHGAVITSAQVQDGLNRGFVGLACGVLVSPNANVFNSVLNQMPLPQLTGHCISGADEQVLARAFLRAGVTEFTHIGERYNSVVGKTEWQPNTPVIMQWHITKPWVPGRDWPDIAIWKRVWKQTGANLVKVPQKKPARSIANSW